MRIAVVGVGGVGGIIGAALCDKGDEISFVARGKHKDEIEKNGLHIIEDERSFTVHPDYIINLEELEGIYDFILLSVKSYDIEETMRNIEQHVDEKSIVMPISNGVHHSQDIRKFTKSKVLDACVYTLSHIERAGVIKKNGKIFATIFGNRVDQESVALISQLFERAKLRYKTPDNIEAALWKKYIFIACFSTLSSYYDESVLSVMVNHADEVEKLLVEINSLAKAKGIDIEEEIPKAIKTARSLPDSATTSMHKDFKAKNRTEYETLSGYIVHEAKAKGLEVPLMSNLYEALMIKQQSYEGHL